jgi:hypothetical protein
MFRAGYARAANVGKSRGRYRLLYQSIGSHAYRPKGQDGASAPSDPRGNWLQIVMNAFACVKIIGVPAVRGDDGARNWDGTVRLASWSGWLASHAHARVRRGESHASDCFTHGRTHIRLMQFSEWVLDRG